MGGYFSKSRNTAGELEAIVMQLEGLNTRRQQLQNVRSSFLYWLAVLTFLATSAYTAIIYAIHEATDTRHMYFLLSWVGGILLFVTIRYTTLYASNILVTRYERQSRGLKQRRAKIIELVKEHEKFKVAKELIEKYGAPEDIAELNPKFASSAAAKGCLGEAALAADAQPAPASGSPQPMAAESSAAPQQGPPGGAMNKAFFTPVVRRQPIRPFIQPSRTPIDKMIDFIVGDGPSNRFALICQQCRTHNGMALREEFESLAFICFNCGLYNPARDNQPPGTPKRPLRPPALADAERTLGASAPPAAMNSDSSGSESAEFVGDKESSD